jgi:hypothetical protein
MVPYCGPECLAAAHRRHDEAIALADELLGRVALCSRGDAPIH